MTRSIMTRSILLQLPQFAQPGVSVAPVSQPRGFPILETAPWYHALPSAVLHDQVQYMRTGRRRLWARWILLILTCGALIGLTVARYVGSDDQLRSAVNLTRDTEPSKMEEPNVAHATCPCQKPILYWADFMDMTLELHDLTSNGVRDFSFSQCYSFVQNNNTELVTTVDVDTVTEEHEKYITLIPEHQEVQNDEDKAAKLAMCAFIMENLLLDLQPEYLRESLNLSDRLPPWTPFSSPYLSTKQHINDSWTAYAKTLIKAHRTSNMIAYAAIRQASRSDAGVMGDEYDQFASDDFGSDSDSTFAEDESSEDGAGGPTSGLYEASMDIIQSAFNDQSVPYRNQIYGHIFTFMQAHVTIDWDKYKQVCNPQYCDIVEIKSVVDRLTEFLSTIGGLWNSLIGVAAVLWWVIDSLSCLGPGESSYRVWHN